MIGLALLALVGSFLFIRMRRNRRAGGVGGVGSTGTGGAAVSDWESINASFSTPGRDSSSSVVGSNRAAANTTVDILITHHVGGAFLVCITRFYAPSYSCHAINTRDLSQPVSHLPDTERKLPSVV